MFQEGELFQEGYMFQKGELFQEGEYMENTGRIKINDNNAEIEDINDEEMLLSYTDNHFIMQINNHTYEENSARESPNIISEPNYNSDDLSDYELDDDNHSETELDDIKNRVYFKSGVKKLSYNDVEKSLNKYFENEHKFSDMIDILVTFLNGQKNVYIHSQYIMRYQLNLLSIPCIALTSIITITAPFIESYEWCGGFISALNACILFLVSLILYLKLESSAEIFLHLANQYDKLETSMEIANNKMMFIENNEEYNKVALNQLHYFENKMNEVKESNTITVPTVVRQQYPLISFVNIFSFIKKVELYKKGLIIKLKDVKNEIRYILHKWKNNGSDIINRTKEHERLVFLYEIKDKIKKEFVYYKNAYGLIDELFTREIKDGEMNKSAWFYSPRSKIELVNNPIIDDYLKFIFIK